MPDNKSVAFTVRVTEVEVVDASPPFICIDPVGGVVCSWMPVKMK